MSVLVVDDNAILASKVARSLGRCGHRVRTAASLAQAHELLERKPPQVICLDLQLPDGNGFDFLEALGRKGDVLIGLSTSGKSKNVLRAFEQARAMGLICIAFLGEGSSPLARAADLSIQVPSSETPRIQEGHSIAGHILCDLVEASFYDGGD